MLSRSVKVFLLPMLLCTSALAQQRDTLLTLKGAVALAEQNYHALQARRYEANAAGKEIAVARYKKLPSIEATYQAGIATANNLTGIFYPNGIVPMSGPPSNTNNYSPATGSAAGLLLNWQAITFGEHNAAITLAKAEANTKEATYHNAVFNHSVSVISNYLDLLLAYDQVSIHQRNIERVEANLRQSKVLAGTGIKAGVDSILFLAELSKARVGLINAQKQVENQQWQLAELLAVNILPTPVDTIFLRHLPHTSGENDSTYLTHPLMQYAQSQLTVSQSKERLLKKTFLPRITIWGTGFARGSGFENDGTVKTWDGMGLSRYNYGAGLQLAIPIMKYGQVKRQLQVESLRTKAAEEVIEDNRIALTSQQHIASSTYKHSLAVAHETEQQLAASQKAFYAMQIRYKTGLVNFSDLIQTQYNLLSAELEVKRSCWDAWKALLLLCIAQGDTSVFLNQIR